MFVSEPASERPEVMKYEGARVGIMDACLNCREKGAVASKQIASCFKVHVDPRNCSL
jgi:hypothetical protein